MNDWRGINFLTGKNNMKITNKMFGLAQKTITANTRKMRLEREAEAMYEALDGLVDYFRDYPKYTSFNKDAGDALRIWERTMEFVKEANAILERIDK